MVIFITCLVFIQFRTEKTYITWKSVKKCDFSDVIMPNEKNKTLKLTQY